MRLREFVNLLTANPRLILGAAFLFCSAGSASALFFSDTQHQNIWFDGLNQSYTWSFDLDSDILDWGDIDSDDDIHSAYLWFGTYDQHDGFEYTDIYLNIQQVDTARHTGVE